MSDQSGLIRAATYSGGTTLALWGLIEIFLRIDPFVAVCFKHLLPYGLSLLSAAVAAAAFRWVIDVPSIPDSWASIARKFNKLLFFGVGLTLLVLFFAPVYSVHCDYAVQPLSWSLAVILFVPTVLVFLAISAMRCERANSGEMEWPSWFQAPFVCAAGVVGLFAISISLGRSEDITRVDVAQEELRQSGLNFSIESLQSALYLNAPRSVELFLEAGVEAEDISLALGATTPANPEEPLLTDVMRRVSGDARNCIGDESGPSCDRVATFLQTFRVRNSPTFWETLGGTLGRRFAGGQIAVPLDCGALAEQGIEMHRRHDPVGIERSIFSHAFTTENTAVLGLLVNACHRPDPAAPIAAEGRASDAQSRRAQFLHALATIDPHLALAEIGEVPAQLVEELCAVGVAGLRDECADEGIGTTEEPTETPSAILLTIDEMGSCDSSTGIVELFAERRLSDSDATIPRGWSYDSVSWMDQLFSTQRFTFEHWEGLLQRRGDSQNPYETRAVLWSRDDDTGDTDHLFFEWTEGLGPGLSWALVTPETRLFIAQGGNDDLLQRPVSAIYFTSLAPRVPNNLTRRPGPRSVALTDQAPITEIPITLSQAGRLELGGGQVPGACAQLRSADEQIIMLQLVGGQLVSPRIAAGDYILTVSTLDQPSIETDLTIEARDAHACWVDGREPATPRVIENKDQGESAVIIAEGSRLIRCELELLNPLRLTGLAESNPDITLKLVRLEDDASDEETQLEVVDSGADGNEERVDHDLTEGRYALEIARFGGLPFGTDPVAINIEFRDPAYLGESECHFEPESGGMPSVAIGDLLEGEFSVDAEEEFLCRFEVFQAARTELQAMADGDITLGLFDENGNVLIGEGRREALDGDNDSPDEGFSPLDNAFPNGEHAEIDLGPGIYVLAVRAYSGSFIDSDALYIGIKANGNDPVEVADCDFGLGPLSALASGMLIETIQQLDQAAEYACNFSLAEDAETEIQVMADDDLVIELRNSEGGVVIGEGPGALLSGDDDSPRRGFSETSDGFGDGENAEIPLAAGTFTITVRSYDGDPIAGDQLYIGIRPEHVGLEPTTGCAFLDEQEPAGVLVPGVLAQAVHLNKGGSRFACRFALSEDANTQIQVMADRDVTIALFASDRTAMIGASAELGGDEDSPREEFSSIDDTFTDGEFAQTQLPAGEYVLRVQSYDGEPIGTEIYVGLRMTP